MSSGQVTKKEPNPLDPSRAAKAGEGREKMIFQSPKGMDEFLKPTVLCDCDDNEIKKKAQELTQNARSPKEAGSAY